MAKCIFLVWNINKPQQNQGEIDRALNIANAIFSWHKQFRIHVVALIECWGEKDNKGIALIQQHLKTLGKSNFKVLTYGNGKSQIHLINFSKNHEYEFKLDTWGNNSNDIEAIQNKVRFLKVSYKKKASLLLAFVHFYSRKHLEKKNQEDKRLIDYLFQRQKDLKDWNDKLVIAGDFNLNPYEYPLYDNNGLLSGIKSTYNLAYLAEQQNFYFYNPGWKFFSEQEKMNYTYLMDEIYNHEVKFNLIDGVILQKELVPHFLNKEYRILSSFTDNDGIRHTLLDNNGFSINKKLYSDHLPIIFAFDFKL